MTGARPEQAVLTRDTDTSKSDGTRRVIEGMVDIPQISARSGVNVFYGDCWEEYDRGGRTPSIP